MIDCNCPENESLETVPYNPCLQIFGKDGRWAFQRLDDAGNVFDGSNATTPNGIESETSWTALPDAVDDTKVVITPILEDVNFPEPDTLDDSENLDGAPIRVGQGPQEVTAIIRNPTPAQLAALQQLSCESGTLTFYRVDSNGRFGARKIDVDKHAGIKISPQTLIVKDPSKGGGRVDQAKTMISFFLPAGWYKSFDVVQPEAGFDPLTEIKPV